MIKPRSLQLFSLIIFMTGCGAENSSPDEQVINRFELITCPAIATHSSIKTSNIELISNSHRFVELYRVSDLYSQQTEPIIDFDKKSVIGIHLGEKSSTGYQVRVTSIEDKESRVVVNYEVISPTEVCAVDTSLTYPYCFVSIPKSTKTVEFNPTNTTKCTN